MILRIVFGRLPFDVDADVLVDLRGRLARSARDVPGLDSLIVGARRPVGAAADAPIEAALVTIWRDPALMARATDIAEQDRFLGVRLGLHFEIDQAIHYELVGRVFAALPPETAAFLRIMSVRARANEEARLMETLRAQQPRLVELGMVASHLGRRLIGAECEAVKVGVWPDRATIRRATGGQPERPLFAADLADWSDQLHLEAYDGVEIAPRLPTVTGPPIYVIDEDLRIVDITSSAAAAIGWPAEDLVGQSVLDISLADPEVRAEPWKTLIQSGRVSGEGPWLVPDAGAVFIRFIAQRDVPIIGRHTVLVHRWHEPPPTEEDLAEALATAFPSVAS
jgi:PAS domain-containing protein